MDLVIPISSWFVTFSLVTILFGLFIVDGCTDIGINLFDSIQFSASVAGIVLSEIVLTMLRCETSSYNGLPPLPLGSGVRSYKGNLTTVTFSKITRPRFSLDEYLQNFKISSLQEYLSVQFDHHQLDDYFREKAREIRERLCSRGSQEPGQNKIR